MPRILPQTEAGRSFLLGITLLAIGLFLAWPPLAFIVPGALFIGITFFSRPEADQ